MCLWKFNSKSREPKYTRLEYAPCSCDKKKEGVYHHSWIFTTVELRLFRWQILKTEAGTAYCIRNNFWQSSNLAVQNGFISRGLPQLFRVAELGGSEYKFWSFCKPLIVFKVRSFEQKAVAPSKFPIWWFQPAINPVGDEYDSIVVIDSSGPTDHVHPEKKKRLQLRVRKKMNTNATNSDRTPP